MGCDIHLHQEVKINGVWHHYAKLSPDRNYEIFAKLADVRNDDHKVDPISQPRGLPADATGLTKFDSNRDGEDGHSHSWIGAEEVEELFDFMERLPLRMNYFEKNYGYCFGIGWDSFTRYPGDRPEGVEDIRWVFWFDN